VDSRLEEAPVVLAFAAAVDGVVAGLYVAGSLATGDYRPGVSDIDAVALVHRAPAPATRAALVAVHQRLSREVDGGKALHCVYVPSDQVAHVGRKHWTWAFDELFRRPFSGLARAELLADPIVVAGPSPSQWLPPMRIDDIRDAVRAELGGYWMKALGKRSIWLQDVYVDIALTVWARADATISDGTLITKTEAIARLANSRLPPDVVDGVFRRRQGQVVALTDDERRDRAAVVRRFLSEEMSRLLTPVRP
jgi:hypothetical protein